mmetsp:Transcript_25013/g.36624  ORF Transcript_25013/g.36624 Transcript_25013/m.36624 type:complete len:94 (-) Transcript_25013:632-913(-)
MIRNGTIIESQLKKKRFPTLVPGPSSQVTKPKEKQLVQKRKTQNKHSKPKGAVPVAIFIPTMTMDRALPTQPIAMAKSARLHHFVPKRASSQE